MAYSGAVQQGRLPVVTGLICDHTTSNYYLCMLHHYHSFKEQYTVGYTIPQNFVTYIGGV